MLRRRRRFTEPEARFFLVQLIGACHWMHIHQVIHRDLKLGNLLLDAHMNVKVGDFGLAALIENPGERKKYVFHPPWLKSLLNYLTELYVEPQITLLRKCYLILLMATVSKLIHGR